MVKIVLSLKNLEYTKMLLENKKHISICFFIVIILAYIKY